MKSVARMIAITVLILALFVIPTVKWTMSHGGVVTALRVAVCVAAVVHLWTAHRTRQSLWVWTPVSGPMLLVLGWMVVSVCGVAESGLGLWAVFDVAGGLVLVHLVERLLEPRDLTMVVRLLACVVVVVGAVYALIFLMMPVVDTPGQAWTHRARGPFGDPNLWAASLLITAPVLVAGLYRDTRWWSRVLLLGVLVVIPVCVVQTMSRSGGMILVLLVPVTVWLFRKELRWVVIASVLFAVILPWLGVGESMMLRFRALIEPEVEMVLGFGSIHRRSELITVAATLVRENPVFGVGLGDFPWVSWRRTCNPGLLSPHNTWLGVWVEQGVVGVLAVGFVWIRVLGVTWRGIGDGVDPEVRRIAAGMGVAVLVYGVMACMFDLIGFGPAWFMVGLILVTTKAVSVPISYPLLLDPKGNEQ